MSTTGAVAERLVDPVGRRVGLVGEQADPRALVAAAAATPRRPRRWRSRGRGAPAACRPGPTRATPNAGALTPVRCTGSPPRPPRARPGRPRSARPCPRRSETPRARSAPARPACSSASAMNALEPRQARARSSRRRARRSRPRPARGSTSSPSSNSRVCSDPTPSRPGAGPASLGQTPAAGSAPLAPPTGSPRSSTRRASASAASSGIGSRNTGYGANGAVRIATPATAPWSRTTAHQRGCGGRLAASPGRRSAGDTRDDRAQHRVLAR